MKNFSHFLPVHNSWPYVQEFADSILQQAYPRFELNVLDNQSFNKKISWSPSLTDSPVRLHISKLTFLIEARYTRIKVIYKQGLVTSINLHGILYRCTLAATNSRHSGGKLSTSSVHTTN